MTGATGHIIRSIAAAGAVFAADGALPTSGENLVDTVERLGLAIALVVFFVATGWAREKRMSKRISKLEADMAKLVPETAKLTAQVVGALTKVADAIHVLESRTCYAFRTREEFDAARIGINHESK